MKRPWFKFYPSDWRADQALRSCSVAARGLWIECMCIMHEADPYGHLVVNGRPVTDTLLARLTGTTEDQFQELFSELEAAGVFSRNRKGVIYSRRMTRDEKRSKQGSADRRRGWDQAADKPTENKRPSRAPRSEPARGAKTQIPDTRLTPCSPPLKKKVAKLDDLVIDDELLAWGKEKCPDVDLKKILEDLRGYCEAHGKRYKDYRAALQNFARSDQKRQRPQANGKATQREREVYLYDKFKIVPQDGEIPKAAEIATAKERVPQLWRQQA